MLHPTIDAVENQGGTVQCFAYVVDDWTEGFDQLFDRYFAAARIRVWDDSVLGERDVQVIGEQA